MTPDLLQPSIAAAPTRPIYSQTALFVPAFFGGPVAAAIMFGINAARSGRLRRDAPFIAIGVALLVLAGVIVGWQYEADFKGWMRQVPKFAGIAAAALFAWRHRALYRAQSLFAVHSPNGWAVGLGALLLGYLANVLAMSLALMLATR